MNNIIELNKQEMNLITGGCNHYDPNCPQCQIEGAVTVLAIAGYGLYYTGRAIGYVVPVIAATAMANPIVTVTAIGTIGTVAAIAYFSSKQDSHQHRKHY